MTTSISNQYQKNRQAKASSGTNVRVIARFRPLIPIESEDVDISKTIHYIGDKAVALNNGFSTFDTFSFDRVFDGESTQEQVFQTVGVPICQDVVSGYNGTVIAYGQTGSGKTHTMMGENFFDPETRGIVPRCATYLFDWMSSQQTKSEFTIKLSMLEIYKEQILDLLNPDADHLQIKENVNRGIYVQDLTECCVISEEELLKIVSIGESVRTVAATNMNMCSSRSHQIVMVEVAEKMENLSEKKGKLNLVDLAGSEKITRAGVTGKNLEEAKKINLSLSCLGNVINALVKKYDHIPYRDSKLTRLLQESLGGNYKTTLIVAASPHPSNFDDTLNTLKFAKRAKSIKNNAKINLMRSPGEYIRIINKLKEEVKRLNSELEMYKSDNLPMDLSPILPTPSITEPPQQPQLVRSNTQKQHSLENQRNPNMPSKHKQTLSIPVEVIREAPESSNDSKGGSPSPIEIGIESFIYEENSAQGLFASDLSSPGINLTVQAMQEYEQLKVKNQNLENQLLESQDLVKDLRENLEIQKKQTEIKSKSLHKFVDDYKKYADKMQGNALTENLKRENDALKNNVDVLRNNLRIMNFKYQNLIYKSKEAGISLDDFEFETVSINEVLDTDRHMNHAENDSIELNYTDLPIDNEDVISTCRPNTARLSDVSVEFYEQTDNTIYQIKNQLTQACLINYNIRRSLSYLELKHYLTKSCCNLLKDENEQQKKQISDLEELLDTMYEVMKDIMNKPAQNPSLPTTTDQMRPSFLDAGSRATIMRRVTRVQKREAKVQGEDLDDLPPISLKPAISTPLAMQNRFSAHMQKDSLLNMGEIDNPTQFSAELKHIEGQLNIQRLYNTQLQKKNSQLRNEQDTLNKQMEAVEKRMQKEHVVHVEHWQNLFNDFKQNCDFQLKRKNYEIGTLADALILWTREHRNLSRKIESQKFNEQLGEEYYDSLAKWELKTQTTPEKPVPQFNFAFAPRSSTTIPTTRGDITAASCETDEDF